MCKSAVDVGMRDTKLRTDGDVDEKKKKKEKKDDLVCV